MTSCPPTIERGESCSPAQLEASPAYAQLTPLQRAVITRMLSMLDTSTDSVVISNPRAPSSPIVYVTEAWQRMCGYSYSEAVGKHPRLTQGEHTDKETIRGMGIAIAEKRSCKVRVINYRGYNHEPFWNCLSLHPVFHKDELLLHVAHLHDYSHRLSRLVSHQPIQFCATDTQLDLPLTCLTSSSLLKRPSRLHLEEKHVRLLPAPPAERKQPDAAGGEGAGGVEGGEETGQTSGEGEGAETRIMLVDDVLPPETLRLPSLHVKRLGFFRIELEPEYLVDRLIDEFEQLDLPCRSTASSDDVYRLEVSSNGGEQGEVTAVLHVMPEDVFGHYSITITRLRGDTFAYHSLYRSLRQRLLDLQERS